MPDSMVYAIDQAQNLYITMQLLEKAAPGSREEICEIESMLEILGDIR